METIGGANNWKLTLRREEDGITILRAFTCDPAAALPETLWGLPVTALGGHALSPAAAPVSGQEVLMTCGPVDPAVSWDNRGLKELTLPAALRRVGDYALLNCGALETLRLHDGVAYWGGGVLMNCRLLHRIQLTRLERPGESLAYFVGELSRELDVTVLERDGQTLRLLFPEYVELYEENCPAHHFDYTIYGAGYPYHHCFRQRQLDLREYDRLWPGYLAMEHDDGCALRLALGRLRYPASLLPEAEAAYLRYLRDRAGEALRYCLEQRDAEGLGFVLERAAPDKAALSDACALARERGDAAALALLLEERHRRFPAAAEKRFAL